MGKNKALFLDRDGVINEDRGYPYKPEDIEFCDGIFPLCKKALEKGYLLIVVTNQAGVAKGYFTEKDVESLHKWMIEQFASRGIEITAFYFCPFHPEAKIPEYRKKSEFRKPDPGMIIQAASDFDIDLSLSIMIGDKPSDRIRLPQLKTFILKSKYTAEVDYDFESLAEIESVL